MAKSLSGLCFFENRWTPGIVNHVPHSGENATMTYFIKMAENLGIKESEFVELLELFVDTSGADISELESALEANDPVSTAKTAHSLKGASASLGLGEISELARQVEKNAKEDSTAGATESIRKIKEKLEELKGLIGQKG
jgi:HPt (histidine-containing phosphotransfer) domain-containing protein